MKHRWYTLLTNWHTTESSFRFNPFTHWPVLTCDTLAAEVPLLQCVCVLLPEKILSREFTQRVRKYMKTNWLTVATRGRCRQRTASDCRSVLISSPCDDAWWSPDCKSNGERSQQHHLHTVSLIKLIWITILIIVLLCKVVVLLFALAKELHQ